MVEGLKEKGLIPLALLREGELGKIYSLSSDLKVGSWYACRGCGGVECCLKGKKDVVNQKIGSMGLKPGQVVEVKQNRPGNPILLRVEETFIALSRKLAMKIMVLKTNHKS
ncbi:FeoA family protein [Thermodesulfobacterium hveragerdense]|uniref:FeoA family protein n=1 Tax=Thermodesulfobacterium hveragerdense TaxID=53424 RepID=UPI000409025E|nr:FeoA family protein [Thermodesulfobacterium hveragerdense]